MEKKPIEETPEYIELNRCKRCGINGGKFYEKDTGKKIGVFLLSDVRGFKICNICKEKGFFMGKEKMNKKEREAHKALKRELKKMVNIPHITLDAKGKKV